MSHTDCELERSRTQEDLPMANLTPRSINGIAIVAAVLILPLLSYGSALLLDTQKVAIEQTKTQLVKAPIAEQQEVSSDLKSKIAAAIAQAETI
ncbi:hypothetical protein NBRC116495_19070 [Aurantivibrio plasticivorans]